MPGQGQKGQIYALSRGLLAHPGIKQLMAGVQKQRLLFLGCGAFNFWLFGTGNFANIAILEHKKHPSNERKRSAEMRQQRKPGTAERL